VDEQQQQQPEPKPDPTMDVVYFDGGNPDECLLELLNPAPVPVFPYPTSEMEESFAIDGMWWELVAWKGAKGLTFRPDGGPRTDDKPVQVIVDLPARRVHVACESYGTDFDELADFARLAAETEWRNFVGSVKDTLARRRAQESAKHPTP